MNRNCMGIACLVFIGFYSLVQAMDPRGLDLWRMPPQTLAEQDLTIIRNSLGSRELTNAVPIYIQYWAFVGILRALNNHEQADDYLNNTMPSQIRQDSLKSNLEMIESMLGRVLAKRQISVFESLKAWACIALIYEKGGDIHGYTDRLVDMLAGATLPPAYEKIVQQRLLLARMAQERTAKKEPKIQVDMPQQAKKEENAAIPQIATHTPVEPQDSPITPEPVPDHSDTEVCQEIPVMTRPRSKSEPVGFSVAQEKPGRSDAEIQTEPMTEQDDHTYLHSEVAQENETECQAIQELEQMLQENAELRRENLEKIDTEAVQAENIQLRQQADLEKQGRQMAIEKVHQQAEQIAELQRNHEQEMLALQRRIEELEGALTQILEPINTSDDETDEQVEHEQTTNAQKSVAPQAQLQQEQLPVPKPRTVGQLKQIHDNMMAEQQDLPEPKTDTDKPEELD